MPNETTKREKSREVLNRWLDFLVAQAKSTRWQSADIINALRSLLTHDEKITKRVDTAIGVVEGLAKDKKYLQQENEKMAKIVERLSDVHKIEKIIEKVFRGYYVPLYREDMPICEMTQYEQGLYKNAFAVGQLIMQSIVAEILDKEGR